MIFSTIAQGECGKFQTRWIYKQKTVEKTENICVVESHANSVDCGPLIQKTCPFSTLKKNKDYIEMIRPIGSTSFNLCHSMEGSPQLYEIKIGQVWKNFERCFWKKTQSFVDLDELVEFYKTL